MNFLVVLIFGCLIGMVTIALPTLDLLRRVARLLGTPSVRALVRTLASTYTPRKPSDLVNLSRRCARALKDCRITLNSNVTYAASTITLRISREDLETITSQFGVRDFIDDLERYYDDLASNSGWTGSAVTISIKADVSFSTSQVLPEPKYRPLDRTEPASTVAFSHGEPTSAGTNHADEEAREFGVSSPTPAVNHENTTKSFDGDATQKFNDGDPFEDPTCTLVIETADGSQRFIPADSPMMVGRRSSNAIFVDTSGVSRDHANFRHDVVNGWSVTPLKTPNGTNLDGNEITVPWRLTGMHSLTLGPKARLYVSTNCTCASAAAPMPKDASAAL